MQLKSFRAKDDRDKRRNSAYENFLIKLCLTFNATKVIERQKKKQCICKLYNKVMLDFFKIQLKSSLMKQRKMLKIKKIKMICSIRCLAYQ